MRHPFHILLGMAVILVVTALFTRPGGSVVLNCLAAGCACSCLWAKRRRIILCGVLLMVISGCCAIASYRAAMHGNQCMRAMRTHADMAVMQSTVQEEAEDSGVQKH